MLGLPALLFAQASPQRLNYPWDRVIPRVSVSKAPAKEVLETIFQQAGVPYTLSLWPFSVLTLDLKNVSLEAALERAMPQIQGTYSVEGGVYHVWIGDISGMLPSGPPETPVLFAASEGLDRISRLRLLALGRSLGAPISWSAENGTYRFYVSKRNAERVSQAYRDDEDLDANTLSLFPMTMVDRFFSLPKSSFERALPLSAESPPSETGPLRQTGAVPEVRRLTHSGWRLERMAVARRSVGYRAPATTAFDVFLKFRRRGKARIVRVQILDGRPWFAGEPETWPRDYAHGVYRNGTT